MKIQEVMNKYPVTVGKDAPISDVADLLVKYNLTAVSVVDDDNKLLGIISEGNITNSIIQQLENDDEIDNIDLKNKFRILRQYTVSVPRKDMSEINDIGLKKYNITYINKEDYSEEEGIIRQKQVIW